MNHDFSFQQKQQLTQAQIQNLEILAMDTMELQRFLRNEYLENPLLDHREDEPSDMFPEPLTSFYETLPSNNSASYFDSESENNSRKDIPSPEEMKIRDYLLNQLNPGIYSPKEWNLFQYLIGCLDDNGFFSIPLEEVAKKNQVSEEKASQCLACLKQLEPYGIFSSNLQESLLRQLDALDLNNEILTRMIQNHLDDIADQKISNISRKLHISTLEVRRNIDTISQLNPRLLAGFLSDKNRYIYPDIILQKDGDQWTFNLNDSWIENYSINDFYIKMMEESTDPELILYFKEKLAQVRLIMNNIQQRRLTIYSITKNILHVQHAFFDHNAPLIPMTMSEIAERTGIHVSTVSRAVKGKYLQYPTGAVFMKDLFSSPVSDQNNVTPALVKHQIKKLIESENKQKPYSDQEIAKKLNAEDIRVSRRTVAKYREELGIKGSFSRRDY